MHPHAFTSPATAAFRAEWASRYQSRHITLNGVRCTAEEAKTVIASSDRPEQDALLLEAITLAQGGDDTARRLLVQVMLGKAVNLSRSVKVLATLPRGDAFHTAVSTMYQVIAEYPTGRRQTNVAAWISFRTIRQLNRTMAAPQREEFGVDDTDLEALFAREPHPEPHAFVSVVKVLQWAIDTHVLTPDEVKLLANFELGDRRERAELVERLGISRETLRQRSWRLRAKLAEALTDLNRDI